MADGPKLAVALVLLTTALGFIAIGWRARRTITSVFQFLPLERRLSADKVGATVVAAGMSMATVMAALVNLAPYLGSALFATVLTFAGGILLVSFGVPRIMRANPQNLVLQEFLGEAYSSPAIRRAATLFTLVGLLSIFSMEILVCVSILEPFFGEATMAFSLAYLTIVLVYCLQAGWVGIVRTDYAQLALILLGVIALGGVIAVGAEEGGPIVSDSAAALFASWGAPASFFVGLACMNLPAGFSDAGTWQRVCSAADSRAARRGLVGASAMFVLIWGALIVAGVVLSGAPGVTAHWAPAEGEPFLTAVLESVSTGGILPTAIVCVLLAGLTSAMISTADGLLVTATQMGLTARHGQEQLVAEPKAGLTRARRMMLSLGCGAFVVFLAFQFAGLDVVQLVFAIYGAQLALFPATAAALFLARRGDLSRVSGAALISLGVGFTCAWGAAIYGHVTEDENLRFLAPAFGLGASTVVLLAGFVRARAASGTRQ